LSFWARAEKGAVRVLARISGEGLSTEAELPLIGGSPGAPNRIQATDLDPWIRATWHEPDRPLPGQPVIVLATPEADEAVASVTLEYSELEGDSESQPKTVRMPMYDDGVLAGGERAFSAMLPPFPDGAVVRYRVAASDISGKSAPPEADKAFY